LFSTQYVDVSADEKVLIPLDKFAGVSICLHLTAKHIEKAKALVKWQ
jgi:hypothetical protein